MDEIQRTKGSTCTELIDMNNVELHAFGTKKESVTPLENELLHRLENYIALYGDWI
tara:strand:- start:41 stop:208 length:168 start_codon:yes stop_codon:yes gene_type:complete